MGKNIPRYDFFDIRARSWNQLNSYVGGPNFVQNAKTKVIACDNMNTYVTPSEVKIIKRTMLKYELTKKKYSEDTKRPASTESTTTNQSPLKRLHMG